MPISGCNGMAFIYIIWFDIYTSTSLLQILTFFFLNQQNIFSVELPLKTIWKIQLQQHKGPQLLVELGNKNILNQELLYLYCYAYFCPKEQLLKQSLQNSGSFLFLFSLSIIFKKPCLVPSFFKFTLTSWHLDQEIRSCDGDWLGLGRLLF